MQKTLVAYFSASGVTQKLAIKLAKVLDADTYEITPKVKYTAADLDWTDKKSRSSIEMADKSSRPEIVKKQLDAAEYGVIFVGFPIWWYTAPTIVNTFLESYDFNGKKVVPFATSGSSGMGSATADLQPSCNGVVLQGRRFSAAASESELKAFADKFLS